MHAEKRREPVLVEVTMVPQSRFYEMTWMNRRLRAWGIILAALMGFLANSLTSLAQDNDKVKAGLEVWKKTGCADCHGAFANGEKERDESPTGANLRTARLDPAELKVVISCGKPGGAGMPAFDEGAYTVRAC